MALPGVPPVEPGSPPQNLVRRGYVVTERGSGPEPRQAVPAASHSGSVPAVASAVKSSLHCRFAASETAATEYHVQQQPLSCAPPSSVCSTQPHPAPDHRDQPSHHCTPEPQHATLSSRPSPACGRPAIHQRVLVSPFCITSSFAPCQRSATVCPLPLPL